MHTVKKVMIPILLSLACLMATLPATSANEHCYTHTVSMEQSESVQSELDFNSLRQGSVLRICANQYSGNTSVYLAGEPTSNSIACSFISRQIFQDDQNGWSFRSVSGSDRTQVTLLNVARASNQCPEPFSGEYVQSEQVSPGVVIQFVNYWDKLTNSIQLYEEMTSSLTARMGEKVHLPLLQEIISGTRKALEKPKITNIAYDHGSIHSPPGYIAMVESDPAVWVIDFDLDSNRKVLVYSILRISE